MKVTMNDISTALSEHGMMPVPDQYFEEIETFLASFSSSAILQYASANIHYKAADKAIKEAGVEKAKRILLFLDGYLVMYVNFMVMYDQIRKVLGPLNKDNFNEFGNYIDGDTVHVVMIIDPISVPVPE